MSDRRRILTHAAIAFLPVIAASFLGQLATMPNLPWHAELAKPPFNPPNAVFGPVWTALYVLMGAAVWRILHLPETPARHTALRVFFLQLALNAAWSWMFFAAQSPLLGVINIVPQLACVIVCAVLFFRLDRIAGACLVPLAAWVGFATILNIAIWRLNG
jgi:benzodiazapine receptor